MVMASTQRFVVTASENSVTGVPSLARCSSGSRSTLPMACICINIALLLWRIWLRPGQITRTFYASRHECLPTPASLCPQLPLKTGDAFGESGMEGHQQRHLMFDVLQFVLIEQEQLLFTDRQWVWERGGLGAIENLFDLLGRESETQVHLDGLHPFNGLLIEVAIAIREAPGAQQPFLFIVT
jgi:hypothetical protein